MQLAFKRFFGGCKSRVELPPLTGVYRQWRRAFVPIMRVLVAVGVRGNEHDHRQRSHRRASRLARM